MHTPDMPAGYAYILRLWQERPALSERPAVWRISLTDTRSGERRGFGDVEALLAFLRTRMGEIRTASEGDENSSPSHRER